MATPTGSGIGGRGGSGVNSAVRGAGLVGLAVVLGIVLLQVIDKGPAGNGAAPARTSHATTPTTAPTPTSAAAPASSQPATTAKSGNAKPRAEVRVLVFNAGAASGAAGNMTNKLRSPTSTGRSPPSSMIPPPLRYCRARATRSQRSSA